MTTSDHNALKYTFNKAADLYDQVRPGYPPELFDDLATLAGIGSGSRILEIGCGTGQATRSLAERGYQVVGIELGEDLAAIARRNLAQFPEVEIVTGSFEDWPLPIEPFDVVFAATAWHWLDEGVRVKKAAEALRPGGTLATVETHHAFGGTEQFFIDAQDCYQRWDPNTPSNFKLPMAADLPFENEELAGSRIFTEPVYRDYGTDIEYATAEYLDVLRTYSPTIAMAPEAAAGLLSCIGKLIDEHYNGRIIKHYLRRMRIATKIGGGRLTTRSTSDG